MTKSPRSAKRKLWIAAVLVAIACGGLMLSFLKYPRINDITTTPEHPPEFRTLAPKPYPETNASIQQAAYPDLAPVIVAGSPKDVHQRALAVARRMADWEIVSVDEAAGTIEAVATTPLMRFKDDVVLEVRPGARDGEAAVHMRSRSRLGRGDFGANAARIRAYFELLKRP